MIYRILIILFLFSNLSFSKSYRIVIKISEQKLYLFKGNKKINSFPISTSKYGIGNKPKSKKTPLGRHIIDQKFGDTAIIGTIFKSRINTNKISNIYTEKSSNYKKKDLITSRILWLRGIEKGKNLGEGVDSYKRNIYIHGTHEEWLIGKPVSHGCIRMRNDDVIELYNIIRVGNIVNIIN